MDGVGAAVNEADGVTDGDGVNERDWLRVAVRELVDVCVADAELELVELGDGLAVPVAVAPDEPVADEDGVADGVLEEDGVTDGVLVAVVEDDGVTLGVVDAVGVRLGVFDGVGERVGVTEGTIGTSVTP